jgi:hypothetical protein
VCWKSEVDDGRQRPAGHDIGAARAVCSYGGPFGIASFTKAAGGGPKHRTSVTSVCEPYPRTWCLQRPHGHETVPWCVPDVVRRLGSRAAGPAEDGAERRPQAVVWRFRSAVGGASHRWWRAPVRARALDLWREISKTLGVGGGRCGCAPWAQAALPCWVSSFAAFGSVRALARRVAMAWAVSGVMCPSWMIPTPNTLTSACR